jgi:hypothetical protein
MLICVTALFYFFNKTEATQQEIFVTKNWIILSGYFWSWVGWGVWHVWGGAYKGRPRSIHDNVKIYLTEIGSEGVG